MTALSATTSTSRMPYADAAFAKAIGRHDRHDRKAKTAGNGLRLHTGPHTGPEDTPGAVTHMAFSVKMLVFQKHTHDVDSPNARVVHVQDIARFFDRPAAIRYAHWLAMADGQGESPHAYDVYEGGKKIYRAG